MRLWTRIKKSFLQDWCVCMACERTISKKDWSWFHRTDEKWYCHPCAREFPIARLDQLQLMSQAEKAEAALEGKDETFWIIIFLTLVFWMGLAVLMGH